LEPGLDESTILYPPMKLKVCSHTNLEDHHTLLTADIARVSFSVRKGSICHSMPAWPGLPLFFPSTYTQVKKMEKIQGKQLCVAANRLTSQRRLTPPYLS
jgi:hypothetical protein